MSKPSSAFFMLLLLTCISTAHHGQNPVKCPEGVAVQCGIDANTVTETLKELPLKANSTIVLSVPPVSSSDVRVFVNGTMLIPGKDFNVTGATVTFLRDLADDALGIVKIRYQSQFASITSQGMPAALGVDGIATDALMRSVTSEDTSGSPPARSLSHAVRTLANNRNEGERTDFRSLRLLVRNLNARQDQYPSKHPDVGVSRGSVQGVEGIGDTSSINNYAHILGISSSESADRLLYSRDAVAHGGFRSLRMLQQQLDGAGGH